ncbi:MAG: hypothetical protein ACXACY_27010 [Candidatus Hodarchaeales archaeon]
MCMAFFILVIIIGLFIDNELLAYIGVVLGAAFGLAFVGVALGVFDTKKEKEE